MTRSFKVPVESPSLVLNGVYSYTTTGTSNDISVPEGAFVIRFADVSADATFTGFSINGATPPAGRLLLIVNADTNNTITLTHGNTGSTTAYRMFLPENAPLVVYPNQSCLLYYDSTSLRWRTTATKTQGLTLSAPVLQTVDTLSASGTTNNYSLSATASILRYTGTADATLTGITGGTDGRMLVVINAASNANTLVLANDSTSSTAANRFDLQDVLDVVPSTAQLLVYDGTTSRWRSTYNPPSNTAPVALGTAAAGTALRSSRRDHVHPTTGLVLDTRTVAATAPITVNGVSATGQALSSNLTIAASAASTSAAGVVQLSDSTSTTSSSLAATSTAVKAAYDLALSASAGVNFTTLLKWGG